MQRYVKALETCDFHVVKPGLEHLKSDIEPKWQEALIFFKFKDKPLFKVKCRQGQAPLLRETFEEGYMRLSDAVIIRIYDPKHKRHDTSGEVFMYFSSDERQDVHLPCLALFDRGYDEAGAAQDDLPSGPTVDW